jgi:hypothetical protein
MCALLVIALLVLYLRPAFDPLGSGSEDRIVHEPGETFESDGLYLTVLHPNETQSAFSTRVVDTGYNKYAQVALRIETSDNTTTNIDLTRFEATNRWRYPYKFDEDATVNSTRIMNARDTRNPTITDASNVTVRGSRNVLVIYEMQTIEAGAWFCVGADDVSHYVNVTESDFLEVSG